MIYCPSNSLLELIYFLSIINHTCIRVFWDISWLVPKHDKAYKIAWVPNENTDQLWQPHSLMRFCCLHEEALGDWLPIQHHAKTVIRLIWCTGWSESSRRTRFYRFCHALVVCHFAALVKSNTCIHWGRFTFDSYRIFLNIRTPKKFVVITLKFELCGSTIEQGFH